MKFYRTKKCSSYFIFNNSSAATRSSVHYEKAVRGGMECIISYEIGLDHIGLRLC